MPVPELKTKDPVYAQGDRLVAVGDLPPSGVVEVQTAQHGTLAVGVAGDTPFAVSNVCRHQFAKLGQGQIREGCLECPWHRARYDVRTGEMVSGPKGRIFGFGPYSRTIQAYTNTLARLHRYDVELRDGVIWLRS
jgi:3-phenylpropionate/trans-cinnamate dioxygenase ferredoxin subunit